MRRSDSLGTHGCRIFPSFTAFDVLWKNGPATNGRVGNGTTQLRVVIQRVGEARVRVGGEVVGAIGLGLVVLVGFAPGDSEAQMTWMADKLWGLRVFADEEGRMNRSAHDVGGALLIVSQFTLYGDASRGRRPSFTGAARPEAASALYDRFVELCRARGEVAEGEFRAMMDVELTNDGPVTLLLER